MTGLLREHRERLALLVRAQHPLQARERLWRALQLHMDFAEFRAHIDERVDIFLGDITEPQLGLGPAAYQRLTDSSESVTRKRGWPGLPCLITASFWLLVTMRGFEITSPRPCSWIADSSMSSR